MPSSSWRWRSTSDRRNAPKQRLEIHNRSSAAEVIFHEQNISRSSAMRKTDFSNSLSAGEKLFRARSWALLSGAGLGIGKRRKKIIFDITFQACRKTKTHNKSFHTSLIFSFSLKKATSKPTSLGHGDGNIAFVKAAARVESSRVEEAFGLSNLRAGLGFLFTSCREGKRAF